MPGLRPLLCALGDAMRALCSGIRSADESSGDGLRLSVEALAMSCEQLSSPTSA